jgi:hypothetical protein
MSDSRDEIVAGRGLGALGGLLLLLCTGCPETWGIDGTMDKAMSKDIARMGQHDECPLTDPAEINRLCGDPKRRVHNTCPEECR